MKFLLTSIVFLSSINVSAEILQETYYWGHRYLLRGPEQTKTARPLVVLLHGCKQTASEIALLTRMENFSETKEFFLLLPEQSTFKNSDRCWNWYSPSNQSATDKFSETALIKDMIDTTIAKYKVDKKNVYIMGLSAGAAQAFNMIAVYPELFSGALLHSGVPYKAAKTVTSAQQVILDADSDTTQLAKSLSSQWGKSNLKLKNLMIVHGDEDTRVTPLSSENIVDQVLLAMDMMDDKKVNNSALCSSQSYRYIGTRNKYGYDHDSYEFGDLTVHHYKVQKLEHKWSGGLSARPYADTRGPNVTSEFLKLNNL